MDNEQQQFAAPLMYPSLPDAAHAAQHITIDHSPYHHPQQSPPSSSSTSSSVHSNNMFSLIDRSVDYTSAPPATSFNTVHHPDSFSTAPHHPSPTQISQEGHAMSLNKPQMNGSIGPDRVVTRRQAARAQTEARRGAHVDVHEDRSGVQNDNRTPVDQTMYLIPHSMSRPQTPNHISPTGHFLQQLHSNHQEHPPLSIGTTISMSPHLMSPPYPSTPLSASSTFSHFGFNHAHSRSVSNGTSNPRSTSPALSNASALTSLSSSGSAPNSQPYPPFPLQQGSPSAPGNMSPLSISGRLKHRKQRLYNVDRKAICVFHKQNPNTRQEDIAARYGVERSTISKILKHKTKWLNVPEGEELRVAKHRPSKFPGLEMDLVEWLMEASQTGTIFTDSLIRSKAKEVAAMQNLSDDKFKASPGWIENFKHRHGIRRGIWTGDGRNTRIARALGMGVPYEHPNDNGPLAIPPHLRDMEAGCLDPNCHDHEPGRPHDLAMDLSTEQSHAAGDPGPSDGTSAPGDPPSSSSSMHSAWPSSQSQQLHHPQSVMHIPGSSPPDPSLAVQGDHSHSHAIHDPRAPIRDSASAAYPDNLAIYQALPQPCHTSQLPLSIDVLEAEDAVRKVVMFINAQPKEFLTARERESLTHIQYAIFQRASGVPYSREGRGDDDGP